MAKNEYYYAVTRVHSREDNLLSENDLTQLLNADDLSSCFNILSNRGWGGPEILNQTPDELIEYETQRTWDFIEELLGDVTPFYMFRYSHDGNNLKAAIKLDYANYEGDTEKFFMPFGTIPLETILNAAKSHDFSALPKPFDEAGQKAYQALSHTANGQNADIYVDNATLRAINEAAEQSGSEFLMEYANITADVANIKMAIRAREMHKRRILLERALVNCGTLSKKDIIDAAMEGREQVYQLLERTRYRDGVPKLKSSMAEFEAWCDNIIMRQIKPQRYAISGIEPLAAFLLARENEIKMVKLILSSKINEIAPEFIKQRMRETYV